MHNGRYEHLFITARSRRSPLRQMSFERLVLPVTCRICFGSNSDKADLKCSLEIGRQCSVTCRATLIRTERQFPPSANKHLRPTVTAPLRCAHDRCAAGIAGPADIEQAAAMIKDQSGFRLVGLIENTP
jgi:hypothetical protein